MTHFWVYECFYNNRFGYNQNYLLSQDLGCFSSTGVSLMGFPASSSNMIWLGRRNIPWSLGHCPQTTNISIKWISKTLKALVYRKICLSLDGAVVFADRFVENHDDPLADSESCHSDVRDLPPETLAADLDLLTDSIDLIIRHRRRESATIHND